MVHIYTTVVLIFLILIMPLLPESSQRPELWIFKVVGTSFFSFAGVTSSLCDIITTAYSTDNAICPAIGIATGATAGAVALAKVTGLQSVHVEWSRGSVTYAFKKTDYRDDICEDDEDDAGPDSPIANDKHNKAPGQTNDIEGTEL